MEPVIDTQCPVCTNRTQGPLCKDHRHKLAQTLHDLRLSMYELKKVANREIRLGDRNSGGHTAFASTPIDLAAADLYNEIETVIADVAGDIGLYCQRTEGSRAPSLLRQLISHIGSLRDAPNGGRNYRHLAVALHRVDERLTPPDERIVFGRCLDLVCNAPLTGVVGDTMVICPACGSQWNVKAVQEARVGILKGQKLTCSPRMAAEWLEWKTGTHVSRNRVSMWLKRDKLPSAVHIADSGEWTFDTGELLSCL